MAVVEPAGPEPFEEPVAAFEVDAEAAADGGVAEGGGEEGLADPDGAHDHGVVAGLDEAQRAQLVPDGAVVGDLGGVVPAVQGHGRVEPGGAGTPVGGGGLAAGDFVGEDELEELGVAHAAGVGEGEPFGEGVEAAAELHPAQQRLELGGDGRRGHRRPVLRRSAVAVDGEVVGVAGEPSGDHRAGQRRLDRRVFGAAFEHPADQPDVDGLVLERAGAGRRRPARRPTS